MEINIFIVILLVLAAFVGGFFTARQLISKQIEQDMVKYPRINIEGVRAMMSSMGQKPNEAKVQQVFRMIQNNQREAMTKGKKK